MEMEKNKFHIIVVDDTMGEKDPFVVELKLEFQQEANVEYFNDVDSAMSFVDAHMSERMILIMDCRFGSVWQGIDAVMKLREKTALIYVIMISANNVSQLSNADITSLINTDNIFFIKNTDIDGAKERVNQIKSLWDSRFDCVLEQWLLRHQKENDKVVYQKGQSGYTWSQLLNEVRLQTPVGRDFERVMNQYCISRFKQEEA
jgi:hypothetical protein